jgi:hypothetical protein
MLRILLLHWLNDVLCGTARSFAAAVRQHAAAAKKMRRAVKHAGFF